MKKLNKLDIFIISISIIILIISFVLQGYSKSYETLKIKEISFLYVMDLYSLALIPILILLFILGKYRITLTLSYFLILSLFDLFHPFPYSFIYNTGSAITFSIISILFTIGIYFLSNQKYLWIYKFINNKYFTLGYCVMILFTLYISILVEGMVSLFFYESLLFIGLLSIIYTQKKRILNYLLLSLSSIILLTFYLGCNYRYYADMGFIDFSFKNLCHNCLNNYLWVLSSFLILYITLNKINTNRLKNEM